MHKNFSKILFIFLIFISNLQASKQSENINFQEQINNLKIEIAVLKSKQEFYDKQNDDKSQITSIENQLIGLENKLNENRQDTKLFANTIERQDNRISDIGWYLTTFGILITVLILFFALNLAKTVKNEASEELKDWIDNKADEEFKSKVDKSIQVIENKAKDLLLGIRNDAEEKLKRIDEISTKFNNAGNVHNNGYSVFDDRLEKASNAYDNKEYKVALEFLKELTETETEINKSQKAIAFFNMGIMYNELNNHKDAIDSYKKSIEYGFIGAMNNLANIYKNELQDYDNATKYYEMAIRENNVDAMFNLAHYYDVIKKDNTNAIKYYKMAIAKGHVGAMNNLAYLYTYEFQEYDNAVKYYKMAIAKDNVDAMLNLAIVYSKELQDFDNAIQYFKMASDKKNIKATNNLAILYARDLKDYKSAIKYYKLAINKDNIDAMKNLASLYKDVLNDKENANKYFNMAKEYEEKSLKK